MTLRKKTLFTRLALFVILLLLINLTFTIFLTKTSNQLDERRMEQNLARAGSALDGEAQELYSVSRIWANSDATWDFMNGNNRSFSDVNLDKSIISTLGISSMIFFNNEYDVKLFKDFGQGEEGRQERDFEAIFINNAKSSKLLSYIPISGLKGVANSGGRPIFFSVQPIFNSNMDKERAGYLLMTRTVDPNLINRLSKKLHFSFYVESVSDDDIRDGVQEEMSTWDERGQNVVNGRLLVRDVGGDPVFWIVGMSRKEGTYGAEGKVQIIFLLFYVAVVCICLLDDQLSKQMIWDRIASIVGALKEAPGSRVFPGDDYNDELSELTRAISESCPGAKPAEKTEASKKTESKEGAEATEKTEEPKKTETPKK